MPMKTDEQSPVCNPSPKPVDELHLMKTAGIIEVAVRNPNVMEYMRHWEDRAEKAEAEVIALREAAGELAEAVHAMTYGEGWEDEVQQEEVVISKLATLRAVLGESE